MRDLLGFQCKLTLFSQSENIVSRVQVQENSFENELLTFVNYLSERLDEADMNPALFQKLTFLLEQMTYLIKQPKKYSSNTIKTCINFLLNGRKAYEGLRNFFHLPHHRTLERHFGGLASSAHIDSARKVLNSFIARLSGLQLNFVLMYVR